MQYINNISVTKEKETKDKTLKLLHSGESVYRWSNTYKDLNDWCVSDRLDSIEPSEILENLYLT